MIEGCPKARSMATPHGAPATSRIIIYSQLNHTTQAMTIETKFGLFIKRTYFSTKSATNPITTQRVHI